MASKERVAIYPGTFDPITSGHMSLIKRGLDVFDKIIVAVADNTPKAPLFTLDERVSLIREAVSGMDRVEVQPFSGLLVDYVVTQGTHIILRGLRATSDFEFEFQLALMNRKLNSKVQTVFLMTDYQWLYISSTIIKAAASHGGDVTGLVPDNVLKRLREKYSSGEVRQGTPCLAPSVGGFKP